MRGLKGLYFSSKCNYMVIYLGKVGFVLNLIGIAKRF